MKISNDQIYRLGFKKGMETGVKLVLSAGGILAVVLIFVYLIFFSS